MTLEVEENPIKSNDIDDIFAVFGVDLFAIVEKGEEELQAPISEHNIVAFVGSQFRILFLEVCPVLFQNRVSPVPTIYGMAVNIFSLIFTF